MVVGFAVRRFRFAFAFAIATCSCAALVTAAACTDNDSPTEIGGLPLPDRRFEEDGNGGGTNDAGPNVDEDAGDSGDGDGSVFIPPEAGDAGPGCNGAIDCERVVFVTKDTFAGSALGGLTGADAKCQAAANANGVASRIQGRTFRAWLSNNILSAAVRIPHGTKPYILANKSVVAKDWNDLSDGSLQNGIDRTEGNNVVGGSAWTGSTTAGADSNMTCGDWGTAAANGTRGNVGGGGGGWSAAGTSPCVSALRLYCFEY